MGSVEIPVIIGYYRYTDIWFEWYQALDSVQDADALKAVLAHDSLVHPDHPLHEEGVEGAKMYMGTLLNGEARLLFSSAQVEYVRYWLHAMQLTPQPIPLPYSDCVLTEADLQQVSPIVFKTGYEVRKSLKDIQKNNKRLKGTAPSLSSRRDLFERVRALWAAKVGVWCAIDFEAWDRDHTMITEVGWNAVWWEDGVEVGEDEHLLVEEYLGYNSTYVAQHRWDYHFGTSKVVKKSVFKDLFQKLIARHSTLGPLFLVFHDSSQDLKYIRSKAVEVPLPDLSLTVPNAAPARGIFVVDTADMFAALEGDSGANRRGLERVCRHLQIATEHLHNAGNDAYYTLFALKEMASGAPLDLQREERWPRRTGVDTAGGAGVRVHFTPWEEDSDYDDFEGFVPRAPSAEAWDGPWAGYDPETGELRRAANGEAREGKIGM